MIVAGVAGAIMGAVLVIALASPVVLWRFKLSEPVLVTISGLVV
jgi:hypothetical protein